MSTCNIVSELIPGLSPNAVWCSESAVRVRSFCSVAEVFGSVLNDMFGLGSNHGTCCVLFSARVG